MRLLCFASICLSILLLCNACRSSGSDKKADAPASDSAEPFNSIKIATIEAADIPPADQLPKAAVEPFAQVLGKPPPIHPNLQPEVESLILEEAGQLQEQAKDDRTPRMQWQLKYADFLRKNVNRKTGRVQYSRIAQSRGELRSLVDFVAKPREFENESTQLSFLLNAYNLFVIQNIIDRWPIDSLARQKGFYDKQKFELLGKQVTLDQLRHDWIGAFGDPGAFLALADGSANAPNLRRVPYVGHSLNVQLERQSRQIVAYSLHVIPIGGILLLSPVFQTHAKSFEVEPYQSTLGFLLLHTRSDTNVMALLLAEAEPIIQYQGRNEALNGE